MKREEVLALSREENEGKYDEREQLAFGKADNVSAASGSILCAVLILLSLFWFHTPEIGLAAWFVHSAMKAGHDTVLYCKLKKRLYLTTAILSYFCAVMFLVSFFLVVLR